MLKEKHLKLRVVPGDANPRAGLGRRAHDVWAGAWPIARRSDSLLPGDVLDLAFTVDYNEHPDFGGVQLTLVDFARNDAKAAG